VSKADRLTAIVRKINDTVSHPVTLIAVSKNAELYQMEELYSAGVRDFAESRLQAAFVKKEKMPKDIVWHFIGPIQSNKAKRIAVSFDVIHSIASIKVAKIISDTLLEQGRTVSCFLEVNTSGELSKEGFSPEELQEALPLLQSLQGLKIQGLMTIAAHTEDTHLVRSCFRTLALLAKKLGYHSLSMGMSGDYVIALEEGATHIRIGSLLFS